MTGAGGGKQCGWAGLACGTQRRWVECSREIARSASGLAFRGDFEASSHGSSEEDGERKSGTAQREDWIQGSGGQSAVGTTCFLQESHN